MVYLLLTDGFEETEAITTVDVLRRAGVDVKTAGLDAEVLTGAHGIKVFADILIDDICEENMTALILPGGGGYVNIERSQKALSLIDYAYKRDLYLAAICAAPSILGKKGILKGRRAVCYPGFEKYLEGAELCDEKAVVSGKIVTANGPGSSIAFAYEIVKLLKGKDAADKVVSAMQY